MGILGGGRRGWQLDHRTRFAAVAAPEATLRRKNRYADQQWIIYDTKRKYGLFYDLHKVEEVTFDFQPETKGTTKYLPENATADKEELFGLLWQDYFRSTNIPARKNMKLHIRHVPKRYWKYLTEKVE